MNTTLTIKIEKKLRDDAKKTAKELGVPLTTAMNAMVRQFVRDKEICLRSHVPNAETRKALREALNSKTRGKSYATAAEMFADILTKR